jgi:sugar-phosphatase
MHGRRSSDTIREVAPHLDAAAEGLQIDQAQARDRDGLLEIPGARRLVRALRGATWAVVTSAPGFLAQARLCNVGLPLPEVLISGDAVERGKPDPAPYRLAADRLGLDPADCVVLEDAPAGVRAATGAGMRVIGVLTHHAASELGGVVAAVRDLRTIDVATADRHGIHLRGAEMPELSAGAAGATRWGTQLPQTSGW